METLNIFTVEKLIFLNPKAKQVLWKEFSKFFEEYIYLKQAGIETALLNKLFMSFFEKFSKKDYEKYLDEIFKPRLVNFNYNFKKLLFNVKINLRLINLRFKEVGNINNFNIKTSNLIKFNLTKNSVDIHEISRQYPNFACTRDKDELKITFWR